VVYRLVLKIFHEVRESPKGLERENSLVRLLEVAGERKVGYHIFSENWRRLAVLESLLLNSEPACGLIALQVLHKVLLEKNLKHLIKGPLLGISVMDVGNALTYVLRICRMFSLFFAKQMAPDISLLPFDPPEVEQCRADAVITEGLGQRLNSPRVVELHERMELPRSQAAPKGASWPHLTPQRTPNP